jgi:hypothetical protein
LGFRRVSTGPAGEPDVIVRHCRDRSGQKNAPVPYIWISEPQIPNAPVPYTWISECFPGFHAIRVVLYVLHVLHVLMYEGMDGDADDALNRHLITCSFDEQVRCLNPKP